MKIILGITTLVNIVFAQQQANLEWSNRYNGPGNDIDMLSSMVIDSESNVYITGKSEAMGNDYDYATLKYSSSGDELLELRYNGINNLWDRGTDLIIDNLGNIIVTGLSYVDTSERNILTVKYSSNGEILTVSEYSDPLNIYLGEPQLSKDTFGNIYVSFEGSTTISIIKYSQELDQQWHAQFSSDSFYWMTLTDIEVDQNANVYITANIANQFDIDIFLHDIITIKFDSQGNEVWVNYYNRTEFEYSEETSVDLEIDNSNNIIVLGYTQSYDDYVILKYSTNGDTLWQNLYDSPEYRTDIPTALVIDSENNILVTGYSYNDSEHFNFATIKYDSLGNLIWAQEYNEQTDNYDFAHSVCTDSENSIYVTGSTRTGSINNSDCLTIKYDSYGNLIWSTVYNDTSSVSNHGNQIIVDNNGDVFVAIRSVGNNSGWDYLTVKYSQGTVNISDELDMPTEFELFQNYPNPFNPVTTIRYELPQQSDVQITIYDLHGRKVAALVSETQEAGFNSVTWNATNDLGKPVSAGVYLYKITVGEFVQTKKLVLLK